LREENNNNGGLIKKKERRKRDTSTDRFGGVEFLYDHKRRAKKKGASAKEKPDEVLS